LCRGHAVRADAISCRCDKPACSTGFAPIAAAAAARLTDCAAGLTVFTLIDNTSSDPVDTAPYPKIAYNSATLDRTNDLHRDEVEVYAAA